MAKLKATVKKVVQQITAWSFSRFKDYAKCPKYAFFKHVQRLREPTNAAMEHGNLVHQQAQEYVQGKLKKLPVTFSRFKKQMDALRKTKGVLCEQEWAFTAAWKPCNWFAADCVCRIKMDVHHLVVTGTRRAQKTSVVVIDYKTGKRRDEEHEEQRSLYAVGALTMYPDALSVVVQHWYLDTGEVASSTYLVDQLTKLVTAWEKKTKNMLLDKRFPEQPSRACQWCFYSKEKGGPCKF